MYNFIEKNGSIYYVVETNTMRLNIPTNIRTMPVNMVQSNKEEVLIVDWIVKKPHIKYLEEFIKRAAHIYKLYKSEMEAFVLWDTKDKKHVFYVPQQTVSEASVYFDWSFPENCILMFELHSHHVMGISFSSIDDHNDSSVDILPHISLVLKNINHFNMLDFNNNIDIRLSYMGNRIPLKIEDLFEMETYSMPQISRAPLPIIQPMYNYNTNYSNYQVKNDMKNDTKLPTNKPILNIPTNIRNVNKYNSMEAVDNILAFLNNKINKEDTKEG